MTNGSRFACAMVLVGMVLVNTMTTQAAQVHVSPGGNDANPGSAEKPLATLAAAQRAARAARVQAANGPVTVWLHQGVYYLPETLRFTSEDAGCTYAAVEGNRVVISGGSKLDLKWEPYSDGILHATTPAGLTFDQLFINGQLQRMARYPNFESGVLPYGGSAEDAVSKERASRWSDPTGGYIHALHKGRWGGMHYRITGKDAKGEITYEGGWQNNRASPMHPKRRYVENIFEELDAPGEWFHNAKTSTLYYYPAKGVDPKSATVEIDRLAHLVEFRGSKEAPVRGVSIRGVIFQRAARTFMHTNEPLLRSDWTIYRGGAVVFTGAEDCSIVDCDFDQVGGNAVMVSAYNRRVTISGCDIRDTGASAVAFVGDPKSVRSPRFEYGERFKYDQIDKTPGPQTDDYPADCVVEDCLIRGVGTVEKQAAGVQISMSLGITVRHCSIYEASRSGINVSEGTFGGHVIEFCDVFDTVLETSDHGSFNSWGRDRFWHLGGAPDAELPALARLDMVRPNIIRNSRWRCDHGWDVDLDDGSSNYEIYNNIFLSGGLKLREGFHRKVYNNIAVNNSLHPHVWYENGGDEVSRNIWMGAYRPAVMNARKWGKEVDRNLFTTNDADRGKFVDRGCDANSIVGEAQFVDAARGDFRVKEGSAAFKIGFENFAMDRFGVRSPRLRAMARSPLIPRISSGTDAPAAEDVGTEWRGATLRGLREGEFSAIGVPSDAAGVLVAEVAKKSRAQNEGIRVGDFIQAVNGQEVRDVGTFLDAVAKAPDDAPMRLTVFRGQQTIECRVQKN